MDAVTDSNQFRDEVLSVVKRYALESNLSVFTMIGTLEVIKMELFKQLEDSQEDES